MACAFLGPSPVSTTSVAVRPTMMPTLGTSETFPSGITHTCSESLTVAFSRTIGGGACAGCCAGTDAAPTTAAQAAATAVRVAWIMGGDANTAGESIMGH